MRERFLDHSGQIGRVDRVTFQALQARGGSIGRLAAPALQLLDFGHDLAQGAEDVLLQVHVLQRQVGLPDQIGHVGQLLPGQRRLAIPGLEAQHAEGGLGVATQQRQQPVSIAHREILVAQFLAPAGARAQGGQQLVPVTRLEKVTGGLLGTAENAHAQGSFLHGQHETAGHSEQVTQGDQHVLQQLLQVGAGQQARIQLLNPGQLVAVLAVEQAVHIGLGQADDCLHEHDADHHSKDQHRVARQAQDFFDLGHHEHERNDDRTQQRGAHQIVQQVVLDHAVRDEHALVRDGIGADGGHERDAQVAHQRQSQHKVGGEVRRSGSNQQVGEDAQARGNDGHRQVSHAATRSGGQAALAGAKDMVDRCQDRGKVEHRKGPEKGPR